MMLSVRQQNSNENSKNRYISYKHLVNSRRKSLESTQSTSFSSTELGVNDFDSLSSDIGFSSYSRSKNSSRESSPSGLYTNWFSGDANMVMPSRWGEQRNTRDFTMSKAKVNKVTDTSDTCRLKFDDEPCELVVVGEGTKLMRDINFPTVIIQMSKIKLHSSVVYYAILEPTCGRFTGNIPCLLFGNPCRDKEDIQTAELLPLRILPTGRCSRTVSLAPMLLQERYKLGFQERCMFKIKAIECGRRLDWKQRRWSGYNMENWEIHNLLKRLISLDVSQMPKHMLKQLTPFCVTKPMRESRKGRRKMSFQSLLSKRNAKVGIPVQNLSELHPDLRLYGLTTRGGSSFADWFNALSPHVQVDKDFTCDHNTKLTKDTFENSYEYDKYLQISDTI